MLQLKNIILVFVVLFISSFSVIAREEHLDIQQTTVKPFFPTQAVMLDYSHYTREEYEKIFDKICNKIIKTYSNDKNFVNAFKKEIKSFKEFRLIQRDTILPGRVVDSSYYGSNYGIHSDAYIVELTNNELKHLKRTLELYCLYNDFADVPCRAKDIENIFKVD